ncbi:MAG: glycosyltransferase family 2 protein [Candidatus Omnitrophica bacterium]|nr:glycosyltransferase family 2 protein [Candidatus Omnitrophota bacterium]
MKLVSIIIPARNEEATIRYVLDGVNNQVNQLKDYAFEVLVAADHCTDNTELFAKEKSANVYRNTGKPGKGNALITGLLKSRGEIIIMLDGDGSHDPVDFRNFIDAIEKGAHLVIGSRAKGGSDEYESLRLFGNALLTLLVNFIFKTSLTDSLNGYKAMRRESIDAYRYRSSGFEIEIEFLYHTLRQNWIISEISSHEHKRMVSTMKARTFTDGFRFLIAIIKWGARYRLSSSMRL